MGPQERGDIESAISRVKEAVKSEDKTALQRAVDDLNKARMKLGEAIYKATAEAAQQGEPAAGRPRRISVRRASRAGRRRVEATARARRKGRMM